MYPYFADGFNLFCFPFLTEYSWDIWPNQEPISGQNFTPYLLSILLLFILGMWAAGVSSEALGDISIVSLNRWYTWCYSSQVKIDVLASNLFSASPHSPLQLCWYRCGSYKLDISMVVDRNTSNQARGFRPMSSFACGSNQLVWLFLIVSTNFSMITFQ